MKKIIFSLLAVLLVVTACFESGTQVDDWKYDSPGFVEQVMQYAPMVGSMGGMTKGLSMGSSAPMMETRSMAGTTGGNLGFAVGGSNDINNFRMNIKNNYLPLYTDITYEGLFYDYFFDTNLKGDCVDLFCPGYSHAITKDPISGDLEHYLAVGLNSNIKESDFQRKKLNLVVVLDISGSMSSSFNRYYYDGAGNEVIEHNPKFKVANEAVVALLDHLNPEDRFGMVVFDSTAFLAKPLNLVGETDMDEIEDHVLQLTPQGGTNMAAGYKLGTELFSELEGVNQDEYENRIIFLTDAQPNRGDTSEFGLFGMTKSNALNKVYSTFIGIGVDFNSELVEYMTKVRGANYYSVHNSKEFMDRMDEQFEFMVTPLVFNLNLRLDAPGYKIERVFGSPEADEATGEILKVNTLFPSKTEEGRTKGGIVLLKLKKLSDDAELKLKVSYEDRMGNSFDSEQMIEFDGQDAEFFDNNAIRKGILLSRYASLVKNWIVDERMNHNQAIFFEPSVDEDVGIVLPPDTPLLGRWERQSIPLKVSNGYGRLFSDFADYFEDEMDSIGDNDLQQELDILSKLASLRVISDD